jgi:uncharacterized protein
MGRLPETPSRAGLRPARSTEQLRERWAIDARAPIQAMPEFVLNVQDIDESGKSYDFPVRAAWLASVLKDTDVRGDDAAPEGRFELSAHKQGADVIVHGQLRASLLVECSRCLEPARIAVRTSVSSLLTARGAALRPEPDELELTPEDLDREFFTGERIELDDIVREHLLLEVPIKPLCSEDCTGIPVPAAVAGPRDLRAVGPGGTDPRGIDPRLAPLLKLVGSKSPTEE